MFRIEYFYFQDLELKLTQQQSSFGDLEYFYFQDLELELTQQQSSFGDFNLAAQRVAQTLEEDSPAIQGIQDTMEDFNQRWNTIASMLNTKMKHVSL